MAQLKERRYADKYRHLGQPIHLIAVEFSSAPRSRFRGPLSAESRSASVLHEKLARIIGEALRRSGLPDEQGFRDLQPPVLHP